MFPIISTKNSRGCTMENEDKNEYYETLEVKIAEQIQALTDSRSHSRFVYCEAVGHAEDWPTDLGGKHPELFLENVKLQDKFQDIEEAKKRFLVFQDNLFDGRTYTQEELHTACAKYCQLAGKSVKVHHEDIDKKCNDPETGEQHATRWEYFMSRGKTAVFYLLSLISGLSEEDAKSCAFVVSFYTGDATSTSHTRGGSAVCRKANTAAEGASDDVKPIVHYLVKALSVLPYFWGSCNRSVQMSEPEQERYKPGEIISWLQFSSSSEGDSVLPSFKKRNTVFFLRSLTGRHIDHLSNYSSQTTKNGEKEVLFLPNSFFLCTERKEVGKKLHIHMIQIEVGTSDRVILWVDDHILDSNWENRKHMEKASANGNKVRFIPKQTTELAEAFLKSPFGQRLKQCPKDHFKIITDMNRPDEDRGERAGAIFIKILRDLGFENEVLVFTSSKSVAENYIKEEGGSLKGVIVTTRVSQCEQFINWKL